MKIYWQFCIACVTFLTAATCHPKKFELLFVQMVYRHGDRTPLMLYPDDPNPEELWSEGLGQLTKLGKKQHYGLGKFFRTFYQDFTTSNPLEINVISSEDDRCLQSAATNTASFYAPSEEWKFETHVDWQPISIHSIPYSEDMYLETGTHCPRAEAEEKRVFNSSEGTKFIAKHKELFANLSFHSGLSITNWMTALLLYDVLFIEKNYNLTIPKWVNLYWDELQEVTDLSFFWWFNSPLLHRLRAGPFLQRLVEKWNKKIDGETPNLKFQIYSAHDTTVAVVLNALNLFNMRRPPYCATLLFELYNGPEDMKFIRLLFLNSTEPEKASQNPHVLVLNGCSEFCSLEYFIDYTRHLIPNNWKDECQL